MTAVLTIHVAGSAAGTCGRPCYDPEHDTCDCVCCGLNHGVGFEQAVANTRDHYAAWVEAARDKARQDGTWIDTYDLGLEVLQPALPGTENTDA